MFQEGRSSLCYAALDHIMPGADLRASRRPHHHCLRHESCLRRKRAGFWRDGESFSLETTFRMCFLAPAITAGEGEPFHTSTDSEGDRLQEELGALGHAAGLAFSSATSRQNHHHQGANWLHLMRVVRGAWCVVRGAHVYGERREGGREGERGLRRWTREERGADATIDDDGSFSCRVKRVHEIGILLSRPCTFCTGPKKCDSRVIAAQKKKTLHAADFRTHARNPRRAAKKTVMQEPSNEVRMKCLIGREREELCVKSVPNPPLAIFIAVLFAKTAPSHPLERSRNRGPESQRHPVRRHTRTHGKRGTQQFIAKSVDRLSMGRPSTPSSNST